MAGAANQATMSCSPKSIRRVNVVLPPESCIAANPLRKRRHSRRRKPNRGACRRRAPCGHCARAGPRAFDRAAWTLLLAPSRLAVPQGTSCFPLPLASPLALASRQLGFAAVDKALQHLVEQVIGPRTDRPVLLPCCLLGDLQPSGIVLE